MDFLKEYRDNAIRGFLKGQPQQLADLLRQGGLNEREREFIASFLMEHAPVPKGRRGPKRGSKNPIYAALIHFWRVEYDGWEKDHSVLHDIACKLSVSQTMARKYLEQINAPKTEGQKEVFALALWQIRARRWVVQNLTPEEIEEVKEFDLALKPIFFPANLFLFE